MISLHASTTADFPISLSNDAPPELGIVASLPSGRSISDASSFMTATLVALSALTTIGDQTPTFELGSLETTALYSHSRVALTTSAPLARKRIAASISAFSSLEENWDGRGGRAPHEGAIENAISFLDQLPYGASPTGPLIESDGEVGVYWSTPEAYIDVTFDDDTMYYFAKFDPKEDGPARETKGITKVEGNAIPGDLEDIIKLISKRVV